jgi:hypothetical protein
MTSTIITTDMEAPVIMDVPGGRIAYYTNKAKKPKPNEDGLFIDTANNQYVVVDGLGGSSHPGEATELFLHRWDTQFRGGGKVTSNSAKTVHIVTVAALQKKMLSGALCYVAFIPTKDSLDVFYLGDPTLAIVADDQTSFALPNWPITEYVGQTDIVGRYRGKDYMKAPHGTYYASSKWDSCCRH